MSGTEPGNPRAFNHQPVILQSKLLKRLIHRMYSHAYLLEQTEKPHTPYVIGGGGFRLKKGYFL